MARFNNGWIKLHRKAVLGDIGSNFTRSGLFSALISIANIQDSTVEWRGKPRALARGELVTSLQELADLGGCDRKTILRHLNYLALRNTIKIEKSFSGVFVKLVNFEEYQGLDAQGSQVRPKSLDSDVPSDGTHIEEGKKERKKEVGRRQQIKVSTLEELKTVLTDERLADFATLYPSPEYLNRELLKALNYYLDNPLKTPKTAGGWKTKVASWLARGWPSFDAKGAPLTRFKPQNIGMDWESEASKLLLDIKRFGPYDDDARKHQVLGDRWTWLSRTSLLTKARTLPENDWSRKQLARDLKDAFEKYGPSAEAGAS